MHRIVVSCALGMIACYRGTAGPEPVREAALPVEVQTQRVTLNVSRGACGDGRGGDCGEPREGGTVLRALDLPACNVGSRIELRRAPAMERGRCELAIRHGGSISVVDAELQCALFEFDANQPEVARVALERASCGRELVAELAVSDRRTGASKVVRVTCQGDGDGARTCWREPMSAPPRELAAFLAGLRRNIEAHDWRALLEMCSQEHRASQITQLGQAEPVYLAEILDLHWVGNDIGQGEPPTFKHLDQIQRIDFTDVAVDAPRYIQVIGRASIAGRGVMPVSLWISRVGDGFVLVGPVG